MNIFSKHSQAFVIGLIVILGAAFIYYFPLTQSIFGLHGLTGATPTPDYSGWHTYSNSKFGVSFQYPPAATVKAGNSGPLAEWDLYGLINGNEIADLEISRSFEPKTNFDGASLKFGASNESEAVSECINPPSSLGYQDTYMGRTIGGTAFHKFIRSEGAAGNFYEFTSYRAIRNGNCQVLEYVIHYSNIQNYPASSGIKEYNKPLITSMLESVIDTVKFGK